MDSFAESVWKNYNWSRAEYGFVLMYLLTLFTRVDASGNHLLGNWGDCNLSTCTGLPKDA